MFRKCRNENGEIMIESMLVLLPTMFVMVFLIALGFLLYQQWNVQFVADSVASRLSDVYSYYSYSDADIKTGKVTLDQIEDRAMYRYLFFKGKTAAAAEEKGRDYGEMLLDLTNCTTVSNEAIYVDTVDDGMGRRHIVVEVSGDYKIPFGAGLEIFGMSSTKHIEASSAAECVDITEYFATVTWAKSIGKIIVDNDETKATKALDSILSALDTVLSFLKHISEFF